MDMPNTRPPTLSMAALVDKKVIAARDSLANYAFHFGVSNDNLDAVAAVDPRQISGIKVFMGASTGNMLVDDPAVLERLFACAPTILLAHCEDTPTILANEAAWTACHGEAIPFDAHPLIRSAEACYRSSSLAVDLARRHGTRLHVLHLSTARELALFGDGPLTGKRITAEACIHHLYFDDADYAALGSHLKCNPAVKTRNDRDALRPCRHYLLLHGDPEVCLTRRDNLLHAPRRGFNNRHVEPGIPVPALLFREVDPRMIGIRRPVEHHGDLLQAAIALVIVTTGGRPKEHPPNQQRYQ
jgi:dihydroorotase